MRSEVGFSELRGKYCMTRGPRLQQRKPLTSAIENNVVIVYNVKVTLLPGNTLEIRGGGGLLIIVMILIKEKKPQKGPSSTHCKVRVSAESLLSIDLSF